VRRALSLLYQGIARAVDEQYRTFRLRELGRPGGRGDRIGLVDRAIRVPRVILLQGYDRIPRRYVRFSRFNIYARDANRCQLLCGRQYPRAELNLDHVVPRSRGGTSVWENVVCSCHRCNRLKGGRTPAEAGHAARPAAAAAASGRRFMTETYSLRRYKEWMPFLSAVDAAYWNTELVAE